MGLFNLRKTFFPERSAKIILVDTFFPGASPLEIEQMVTLKIENNIDGITGVKRITSNFCKKNVKLSTRNVIKVTLDEKEVMDQRID